MVRPVRIMLLLQTHVESAFSPQKRHPTCAGDVDISAWAKPAAFRAATPQPGALVQRLKKGTKNLLLPRCADSLCYSGTVSWNLV
jgi:hypothetical protein